MSLKGVSATLSSDGTPLILLMKEGATLETLPIQKARSEHRNFILGTWVRSYAQQARDQGIGHFYKKHEPSIAESRWMDCLVVTDDTGFTVHAWACGRDGQLWHVYVVPELRRLRVATRLIEFTCGKLEEYARPWPYSAHARVNPYILIEKESDGI
jgi:GNAT superfamily N-acetyltransferase